MSTIIDEEWWDEQFRKEEEAYNERMAIIRAVNQANMDRRKDAKNRSLEMKRRRTKKREEYERTARL